MSNSKKRRNPRNQHNAVSVSNHTSSSPEKQGNGLSRADQVTFGLKIEVLIEEELKFSLNTNYQAPTEGKVAVMIITSDNLGHIWKVKSYILRNFKMVNDKITGHGSIAGTLKYNLSEVQLTSFEKVEERYKLLFPEGHKRVDGKHPHLIFEELLVPVQLKKIEQSVALKPKTQNKVKAESRTVGLSQFLHAFLCSDRKISRPNFESKECQLSHFLTYSKNKIGKDDVLNCVDEIIAIKVESSIEWLLGSKFVVRDGLDVMVDLSYWKDRERRLGSINFTLPPKTTSSTDEVSKRLARASITSKPTSVRREGNMFVVTYQWKTTGCRVFDVISKMGWNAGVDKFGNLLVYVDDIPQSEVQETIDTSQPAEEIPQIVEEEAQDVSSETDSLKDEIKNETGTPVSNENKSFEVPVSISKIEKPARVVKNRRVHYVPIGKDNPLVEKFGKSESLVDVVKSEPLSTVPLLSHLVHDKKDAFDGLSKLYNDPKLFSMLPKQMQSEVILTLKDNFMEENPVDYAAYLLALLKK